MKFFPGSAALLRAKLPAALGVCPMCASALLPIPIRRCSDLIGNLTMIDPSLLPEQKLAILRVNDPRRKWHSLDDQRVCVLCGRTINGRQIEIKREPGGSYSVHCPTENCPSVPSDWFYQGNASGSEKNPTIRTGEATLWAV
jgi:hypothetical protein